MSVQTKHLDKRSVKIDLFIHLFILLLKKTIVSEKIQLFLRQAHCSSKVGGQDFFSLFSAFKHNNTCTYLGFNSRYFCAICSLSTLLICLKQRPSPYGHWTLSEQKTNLKVHRFTNNLQGLQKVTVKDFP